MVAAIGAAAALGGAAISASGAKSAASTQSAASDRATMLQMQAQAQQRSDLQPWVQSGQGANSLLNRYLGIGGVGSSGVTSSGLATGLSPDQVRAQLMSRYTTNTGPGGASTPAPSSPADAYNQMVEAIKKQAQGPGINAAATGPGFGPGYWAPGSGRGGNEGNPDQWVSTAGQGQGPTSSVDENALNAAIQQYYAEQGQQNDAAQSDPTYGSLLRAFHNGEEFDPGAAFSFTGKDLASEPGYQFGLNQGTQGVERGQASRGNFLSGAALKELDRYNQDYAGTKFGDAFNRSLSTYNTNLGAKKNAWDTNLGAYNDNRNRVFNFLNGVSTLGQNSAAGTGAAALQVANNVGSNMLGSANAQAASTVAGGNALQSGINGAVNNYNSTQNTQNWNNLLANRGSTYDTGFNGQNNPTNQAGLDSLINKYQG